VGASYVLVAIAASSSCKPRETPAERGAVPVEAGAPSPQGSGQASGQASGRAAPAGHVVLVDAPADGPVDALVRNAASAAAREKRRLLVYAGATWCEPCQRFHQAAAAGSLDATFPDLTMLVFDMDRDAERLAAAGYVSKYIPLFALPAADGTASGKQVEGGIKGEGAVGYIVPRLRQLLGG
jgi:thiol-disulfide isomerase/thioredoxin